MAGLAVQQPAGLLGVEVLSTMTQITTSQVLKLSISRGQQSPLQARYFTARKRPQYPLNRRLGALQNQSGHYEKQDNFLQLLGIKPKFLSYPAHSPVTAPNELSQLLY